MIISSIEDPVVFKRIFDHFSWTRTRYRRHAFRASLTSRLSSKHPAYMWHRAVAG
jgi:hypothetical protein